MSTLLKSWETENLVFWNTTGNEVAWRTLNITTISLTLSFVTWIMVCVLVSRLDSIEFNFRSNQLFWLAVLPVLATGRLWIVATCLILIIDIRHVITVTDSNFPEYGISD